MQLENMNLSPDENWLKAIKPRSAIERKNAQHKEWEIFMHFISFLKQRASKFQSQVSSLLYPIVYKINSETSEGGWGNVGLLFALNFY